MDTPHPSPRTKWTRRVPHPVLIGHAASLRRSSARATRAARPPSTWQRRPSSGNFCRADRAASRSPTVPPTTRPTVLSLSLSPSPLLFPLPLALLYSLSPLRKKRTARDSVRRAARCVRVPRETSRGGAQGLPPQEPSARQPASSRTARPHVSRTSNHSSISAPAAGEGSEETASLESGSESRKWLRVSKVAPSLESGSEGAGAYRRAAS